MWKGEQGEQKTGGEGEERHISEGMVKKRVKEEVRGEREGIEAKLNREKNGGGKVREERKEESR